MAVKSTVLTPIELIIPTTFNLLSNRLDPIDIFSPDSDNKFSFVHSRFPVIFEIGKYFNSELEERLDTPTGYPMFGSASLKCKNS